MNHIPKCTLVPTRYLAGKEPRFILSEVAVLAEDETVGSLPVPEYDAVLLHTGDVPELYQVLCALKDRPDYYKIVAHWQDGCLSLAIAEDKRLIFANVFEAKAFTTAEYFLFTVMKSLQLNPEISTVCFLTPLAEEERMSLYRYFKSVEQA